MDQHIREIAADVKDGIDPEKAFKRRFWINYANVVHMPGMPPRYDWEYRPMEGLIDMPIHVIRMVYSIYDSARDPRVVAIISPGIPGWEPEARVALEKELGKEFCMIG